MYRNRNLGEKVRILHVVPTFYPCLAAGGVVNAVYHLAKKQAQVGNEVSVFTTTSCKEPMNLKNRYNIDVDGVKTYYFKNLSNFLKNRLTIDTPYILPLKLRKEIKNYDIVHIHEHRHSLAIATSYYALKNNIPYVLQAHGSVLPFFQKEKMKEIFDKLWGFKILHNASKVFALTEVEKNQYLKMGIREKNIEIVPLGINLEEYSNLPQKGKFREKYNVKTSEKLLLFIGRIHEIKGLDLLIESFALLTQDIENIKLAIVGPDDGYLEKLKKIIEELNINQKNLIMTGSLYGENKKEGLVDCDIFIMPSQYESFTTSGLEAIACEKPLVLTKNNHIHTWVDKNVGLSCEYEKKDLSDNIKKLLKNPDMMKYYGKNGMKEIKEKYNWDSIEKQVKTIYKEVIK